jgi:predicted transcriptional regulator
MSGPDPTEILAVVARRGDVLRAMSADGTWKSDLDDELDVSRSTIDRSVRELEAMGLVERTEDGYRQTLAGRIAQREYGRFRNRMEGVLSAREVLSVLPSDAEVDATVLEGAEVVLADRHAPLRPVRSQVALLDAATHVRAAVSALLPQQVEAYHEAVVERGVSAEVVLPEPAMAQVVGEHAASFAEMLRTGRLHLRRTDEDLPYSVTLVDRDAGPAVGVLVFSDDGIRGFLGNERPAAVEWARERLAERWAAATPVVTPAEE